MSAHSIIPPSSSARRVQCPQSTTLEAIYPEDGDSEEAREGTAAHWALAEQLEGRLVDVGQIAGNGVVLTLEMVQGADLVYDYVVKLLKPFGLKPQDGQVEKRVNIPRVHAESWGTPDYWIMLPDGTLFILDFKFGYRFVGAHENMQLVEYVAGVTDGVPPHRENMNVHAVVAQPRSFHRDGPIREWATTLLDLRALINVASNAAHEALGPNPRARTGPECRDCRARHACPALQADAMLGADQARKVTPLVLDAASAALEKRIIDQAMERLKARRTGLDEQLTQMLQTGKQVPGYTLARSSGREAWTKPAAEVIALGELMGIKVAKRQDAITPNQAREAGMHESLVAAMSTRTPGALTLVEDDGSTLRRIFG